MNYKKDFPIFRNNPGLVYMDSTATSQKPSWVINGIKEYLETSYSTIHRGAYDISIISEKLYKDSKKIVAKHLGVQNSKEIIYTYNSTYASNILVQSLRKSNYFKAGDKVLLTISEHHANILPWLILKEEVGIEIVYIKLDKNWDIDLEDFDKKYDNRVKAISFTHVSNVLGKRFNLEEIGKRKRDDTLFVVDASQSVPHFKVDVNELNCDALFFTGHKVFADSGIGVLRGKTSLLSKLTPIFSGGGAIGEVTCQSYTNANLPDKFEPGIQNISGAVSLLRAFEYIESIGGYEKIENHEKELVSYFMKKFEEVDFLIMIGTTKAEDRASVFSFIVKGHHSNDVGEVLALAGIAVRTGKHCAHPLLNEFGYSHTVRVSLYIYNTKDDIDKLFHELKKLA